MEEMKNDNLNPETDNNIESPDQAQELDNSTEDHNNRDTELSDEQNNKEIEEVSNEDLASKEENVNDAEGELSEDIAEVTKNEESASDVVSGDSAQLEETNTEESKKQQGKKRIITGKVFSNRADKTIVVKIERQVIHPLYRKYYKKSKKVMAHDELNTCNIGDTVRLIEHRPLSAKKRWKLLDVLERAK